MRRYLLGVDGGNSKTRALVIDAAGRILGFGASGPGNVKLPEARECYTSAVGAALHAANLKRQDICASAFGLAGYDWPSEASTADEVIDHLALDGPRRIVNDTILALVAGATRGWGVAVVAGTSANCRGRDPSGREARTVGCGASFGDAGGAAWIVWEAVRRVAMAWTGRERPSLLADLFCDAARAPDVNALVESLATGRSRLDHRACPLVFEAARRGDDVARDVLDRAGHELGLNAATVSRRLALTAHEFEVVLVGGVFRGAHPALVDALAAVVQAETPRGRLVRLSAPPVIGAALLALDADGAPTDADTRRRLMEGSHQLSEAS